LAEKVSGNKDTSDKDFDYAGVSSDADSPEHDGNFTN
jgi:hypothetical protein